MFSIQRIFIFTTILVIKLTVTFSQNVNVNNHDHNHNHNHDHDHDHSGPTPNLSNNSTYDIYEQCGKDKGCFGFPRGCVGKNTCSSLVTFRKTAGGRTRFELRGRVSSLEDGKYVSVGFSGDRKMGNDSVFACFVNSSKVVKVEEFFNAIGTQWSAAVPRESMEKSSTPLQQNSVSYLNGFIYCDFTLSPLINLTHSLGTTFDLNKDKLYLLLARAESGASEDQLGNHDERDSSLELVHLSEPIIVDESYYDGCGITKGCFALPSEKCIGQKNCQLFVSAQKLVDKNVFQFQMFGKGFENSAENYIALGLSKDDIMGSDNVVGCYKAKDGGITMGEFFNPARYNTHVDRTGEKFLGSPESSYKDGFIYCTFTIRPLIPSTPGADQAYDLNSEKVHLMLSRGNKAEADHLGKHPAQSDRGVTSEAISLGEIRVFPTKNVTSPASTTPTSAISAPGDTEYGYGCKQGKTGCFGIPTGCITSKNCDILASYQRSSDAEKILEIYLTGKTSGATAKDDYVAVGFSSDAQMGDDSVFGCYRTNGGESVVVGEFYNVKGPQKNNVKVPRIGKELLHEKVETSDTGSFISCRFFVNPVIKLDAELGRTFNLTSDKVFLLLARGSGASAEGLGYHPEKGITPEPVSLLEFHNMGEREVPTIEKSGVQPFSGEYGCEPGKVGCFGLPNGCVETKTCLLFASYKRSADPEKSLEIHLIGQMPTLNARRGYIAVGFSTDGQMANDSVFGCYLTDDGNVEVGEYYNVRAPMKSNLKVKRKFGEVLFEKKQTVYKDSFISCRFDINPVINLTSQMVGTFNLTRDKVFLLLSRGPDASAEGLGQHRAAGDKGSSAESVSLLEFHNMGEREVPTIEKSGVQPFSGEYGCEPGKVGCFGLPNGCVETKTCLLFASYQRSADPEKSLEIHLMGQMPTLNARRGYIAIGFSTDGQMANDSVFGCYLTDDGNVEVGEYYNVRSPMKSNLKVKRKFGEVLFEKKQTVYKDSFISCRFDINPVINLTSQIGGTFNLTRDKVFLLLSRGPDASAEGLGQHREAGDKGSSAESVSLLEFHNMGEREVPTIEKSGVQPFSAEYGCESGKVGCFGLPNGCVETKTCLLFASYQRSADPEKSLEIHLIGQMPTLNARRGYIAIGFSTDGQMANDSVFGCYLTDDGKVEVGEYYNVRAPMKSNLKVKRKFGEVLFEKKQTVYKDSFISCRFDINPVINLTSQMGGTFNLTRDKVFLLLSRGPDASAEGLGQHREAGDKGSSAESVSLLEFSVARGKSGLFIQLHGTLMVLAWILMVPVGMYAARYFKQTFTTATKSKALWFWIHQICMFATVLLTTVAIILIFLEVESWSVAAQHTIAERYHPILGVVVFGLCFLQVFIAFMRPEPSSSVRIYFNWIHWTVGTSAWILAIACIHLAYYLKKSNLSAKSESYFVETLYTFIVLHFVLHLMISIHTFTADQHNEILAKFRALLPGPMRPSGTSYEYKGTSLRAVLLTLEILVCSITALVLSTLIFSSLET